MIISRKKLAGKLQEFYFKGESNGKRKFNAMWQVMYDDLEKQYNGLTQDNARLIEERNTAIEGYKELEQEYNKLKKSNEVIRQAIIESNKQELEWLNGKHWDDVDG